MTAKVTRGFTIVELLIVIVVIATLASISVVAYNGIQQRARDSKRVSDINQIAKGLQLWSSETGGSFATMNAGALGGTGVGWFDSAYSSPQSVRQLLIAHRSIDQNVIDPQNIKATSAPSFAYMISECVAGDTSRRVVLARLENAPSQTVAQQIGTTCNATTYTDYTTNYGMTYAKLVTLSP